MSDESREIFYRLARQEEDKKNAKRLKTDGASKTYNEVVTEHLEVIERIRQENVRREIVKSQSKKEAFEEIADFKDKPIVENYKLKLFENKKQENNNKKLKIIKKKLLIKRLIMIGLPILIVLIIVLILIFLTFK